MNGNEKTVHTNEIIKMLMKQLCYVDGTKCNTFNIRRKRPPTTIWTAELLSEREHEELLAGGFGLGEIEEPFVEEEGDPTPEHIEVICNVIVKLFYCVRGC